ncbi:MAG: DUF2071 domain-containing protein [Gaiellaceae bacterium]
MRLRLEIRDLLLASWETDRKSVGMTLPPALEPAEVEGRFLVTAVCMRARGGRLGRVPVPPFSQLNVRTYCSWEGEPAVFFVRAHVTPLGMGGALLGAPYRPSLLRLRRGFARAPGLGFSLRYELGDEAEPGLLGRHELGIFEAGGLRAFRVRRGPASWRAGEEIGEGLTDVLLALGFDVHGVPDLLYAPETSFEMDVPARRLETASRSASRSAR